MGKRGKKQRSQEAAVLRKGLASLEGPMMQGDFRTAFEILDNLDWDREPQLPFKESALLAELLFYRGDHAGARMCLEPFASKYDRLVTSAAGATDPARARLQLAEYFYSQGDEDPKNVQTAVQIAQGILSECEAGGDLLGSAEACFYLERFCRRLHQYDQVERYADGAVEKFCALGTTERNGGTNVRWRLGLVFSVIGFSSWRAGDLGRATSRLQLARRLLGGTRDFVNIANVEQGIGCIRRSEGENPEALRLFEMAQKHYEHAGHQLHLSRVLSNAGQAYLQKKEWKNAKSHFERALTGARQIESARQIAEVLIWLSWLYQEAPDLRDLTAAERCAKEAIALVSKRGLTLKKVEAWIALGYCRLAQENYKKARDDFERALCEAEELKSLKLQVNALLSLAECNCVLPVKDLHAALNYRARAEKLLTLLGPSVDCYLKEKLQHVQEKIAGFGDEVFAVTVDKLDRGLKELAKDLQKWAIQRAMDKAKGKRSHAAEILDLTRPGFDKMWARHFPE